MKLSVMGPRIWRRLSRCLSPSGGGGASVAPEPGGGVHIYQTCYSIYTVLPIPFNRSHVGSLQNEEHCREDK